MERRFSRQGDIHFGMHVFDAHDQLLGTVVLARKDHFVMRQELGIAQLVAVPRVAVTGVIAGLVLLSLTPGEIEIFCQRLDRKDQSEKGWRLLPRLAPGRAVAVGA